MSKHKAAKSVFGSGNSRSWVARDAVSGRSVEVEGTRGHLASKSPVSEGRVERRPGRFKHILVVGPEFFEPLSEADLSKVDGA